MNHLEFDGFQFDVEVKLYAEVEDLRLIWKLRDFTVQLTLFACRKFLFR